MWYSIILFVLIKLEYSCCVHAWLVIDKNVTYYMALLF